MEIKKINELEVYYEDKLVGYLKQLGNFNTAFCYTKKWLEEGFSISPFKLPLEEKTFICSDPCVQYMFGVFYDCLPDSWGNRLVDKFLVSQGINPATVSILQRLALLNQSSLGALTFKPSVKCFKDTKECDDFDELFSLINNFLNADEISETAFLDLYHNGSSTGGSRPKVNAVIKGEEYIVKFPSRYDPLTIGFDEYNLNQLAAKCGLNPNEHILLPSKNSKGYFAAKRFDRFGEKRFHVVSLAGLFDLNPQLSQIHYLGFLQTVKALCPEDLNEAIGRMIFNYLIENKDDHPRNFSFIYVEKEKKYRLSPFFDITSTPSIKEHMMLVNDKEDPEINDFVEVCKKVNVNKSIVLEIYNRISKVLIDYKKTKDLKG